MLLKKFIAFRFILSKVYKGVNTRQGVAEELRVSRS